MFLSLPSGLWQRLNRKTDTARSRREITSSSGELANLTHTRRMWVFCVAFAEVRLGFCGASTEDSLRVYRSRPIGLVAIGLPGFECSPRLFLGFSGRSPRLLRRIHRGFVRASRTLAARVGLGRMVMWLPAFGMRVLCGDSAELLWGIYRALRPGYGSSTGALNLISTAT